MYTKEQIEETCKNMPWLAYQQGLQDGYNGAFRDLRNQAAISAMHGILGNMDLIHKICIENSLKSFNGKVIANVAVQYADALVRELKGNDQ